MTVQELYQSGRLADALQSALADVKSKPSEIPARRTLCDLLCFSGDLERADKQLDAIGQLDAKAMFDVSLTRHLLRAEQVRRDFYADGRLPEFLDQPTAELKLRLEASIRIRENKVDEAAELLAQAEEQRPRISGTRDGQAFDDFRDLDDLTASFFEVLTTTGKYYWVPIERVELIEFKPAQRMRDLVWRSAHMVVTGGPDGEVFLPALYAGSHVSEDEQVRLGRTTQWQGDDGAPIRGIGQRIFLVGDDDCPIMELSTIEFASRE